MSELKTLKQELENAINERDNAKQFSRDWFVAKAKVEDLLIKISKKEFAERTRITPVPDDFVFDVWDDDD